MKHLFIINPVSGKLPREEKFAAVKRAVAELPPDWLRGAELELYETTCPMDAKRKVEEEAEKCSELRVYSCGGDGTLNECVCGAAHRENVAVTPWPLGTGNDFIKMFGKEKKRFYYLDELVRGEVRKLDLINCNGRYSINICSAGVDARVGTDVHKYSNLPLVGGAAGYVVSALAHFIKGINCRMTVSAEGLVCGPEMNMVCACNGRFYGGGFNPTNDARPDDGLMDVMIVSGVTRRTFLSSILCYARGGYKKLPRYITCVRTTELTIDCPEPEVINIDGELERGAHIVMRLEPEAVNLIVPRKMKFFES